MKKFTLSALMATVALVGSAATPDYTLNPAPGEVTNLSAITLTFPTTMVAYYENSKPALAVLENTTTGDSYYCFEPQVEFLMDEVAGTAGIEYTLKFYEMGDEELAVVTTPGAYTLTVRGLYVGDEEGEPTEDLEPLVVNYNIAFPAAYELLPAPGSKVTDLQGLILNFTADKVGFSENNRMPVAVLENTTTGVEYLCYEPDRLTTYETNGAAWKFMFVDEEDEVVAEINAPGNYLLTVRGMYVGEEEDGNYLPVITANYSLAYPVSYALNPADGALVESLSTVTIEFPFNKNVTFYENSPMPIAVLTNGLEGDEEIAYYCYEPDRDTRAMTDGVAYNLVFLDGEDMPVTIEEEGHWYLTVRGFYLEGETEDDNVDLPVITAQFYVGDNTTAVSKVGGDSVYNVYSINGLQVVRNGNAASINELPAGLYIINGKKVVVRK